MRLTPRPAVVLLLFALVATAAAVAAAQEPSATRPASPQSPEHTRRLEAAVARCDDAVKADPKDAAALQARAEALFRLGRVAESVRDFDRVVELDPAGMPHNWQRGIALYYAGRFADAAKQFARHREVNPQDVENAAFHFACVARSPGGGGPAAAAKVLIPIDRDPRVPLMAVHALYAGRGAGADVLAAARRGDPPADELRERLFYAHYYLALWHEARGRGAEAAGHARLAATEFAVDGYMGDVARVHAWLAAGRPAEPTAKPLTAPASIVPAAAAAAAAAGR